MIEAMGYSVSIRPEGLSLGLGGRRDVEAWR